MHKAQNMQIFAMCMECQKELGHPSFEPFFVPYYEDRIAHITCSRGHNSVYVIQSQKFEVLMESGVNALAAGFTLEACASFSAALERLYEFALKVLATHLGVTEEAYNDTYKEMSRQSERQLGAFFVLFALQFGSAYKPNRSTVEFRNSVIHKGLIPTPEEAHEFCSKVYSEILSVTERLQANLSKAMNRVVLDDLQGRYAKADANLPKVTAAGGMFFSLSASINKQSFDEAFRSFQEAKEILLASIPQMEAQHLFLRAIEAHNSSFKPTPSGAA
jgi:hypothetical protein